MTTRVTSCSRVTRRSSDNTIWRQVYTIQQMAHAVSCFDSDPQSQPDPINEGGGGHKYTKCHNSTCTFTRLIVRRNIGQMAYRVELEYRLFLSIDSSLYRPKTIFVRGCAKFRPLAFF